MPSQYSLQGGITGRNQTDPSQNPSVARQVPARQKMGGAFLTELPATVRGRKSKMFRRAANNWVIAWGRSPPYGP
jgi:hypothetical protein